MLKSKHGQRDSHMELVNLHIVLGEMDEAKKEMALAKVSMAEIALLEEVAMQLDSAGEKSDDEVTEESGAEEKTG